MDLARGYTIWQDLPDGPGQVLNYVGKCEKYVITTPQVRFFVDEELQKRWVKHLEMGISSWGNITITPGVQSPSPCLLIETMCFTPPLSCIQ